MLSHSSEMMCPFKCKKKCTSLPQLCVVFLYLISFIGSLFENEWSLKPEYKRGGNRLELADRLASRILWIGIANLLLCPVILVWQILYAFFSYTEVVFSQELTDFKQQFKHFVIIKKEFWFVCICT